MLCACNANLEDAIRLVSHPPLSAKMVGSKTTTSSTPAGGRKGKARAASVCHMGLSVVAALFKALPPLVERTEALADKWPRQQPEGLLNWAGDLRDSLHEGKCAAGGRKRPIGTDLRSTRCQRPTRPALAKARLLFAMHTLTRVLGNGGGSKKRGRKRSTRRAGDAACELASACSC